MQAQALPATLCLSLLSALETGTSDHSSIQRQADQLQAACCDRVVQVFRQSRVDTAQDAGALAKLVAFFGPWQDMLNDPLRRDLFARLPRDFLRGCLFQDANVQADCEATGGAAVCVTLAHLCALPALRCPALP